MVGKTKKSDKVAMDVLFGDGATTPFYMNKHPKAKEGLKDVLDRLGQTMPRTPRIDVRTCGLVRAFP